MRLHGATSHKAIIFIFVLLSITVRSKDYCSLEGSELLSLFNNELLSFFNNELLSSQRKRLLFFYGYMILNMCFN